MPRNKILAETGKFPEELTREEREALVKATPQFKKHIKTMEKISDSDSIAYKSKKRALESNAAFLNRCLERGVLFNSSDKIYSNVEDLKQQCLEFVEFCIENEFAMNLDSLSTWLGVSREMIRLAISNSSLDERFAVLRGLRQIMDTLLSNEIMNYEGNAANKMFVAKCRMDWQEYPTTVNVNISNGQSFQQSPADVLALIDATPGGNDGVEAVDVEFVDVEEVEKGEGE